VVLPPSALSRLLYLKIDYPMIFQIRDVNSNRATHCGVLQFDSPEGICIMPSWLMTSLGVANGGFVELASAKLPNATFVRLKPHQSAFMQLANPRVVMETTLRDYATLTEGETIYISYNEMQYGFDVVVVNPRNENALNAVSIINTDVSVEFDSALDEPEQRPVDPRQNEMNEKRNQRIAQLADAAKRRKDSSTSETSGNTSSTPLRNSTESFQGVGRKLDGTLATTPFMSTSTSSLNTSSSTPMRTSYPSTPTHSTPLRTSGTTPTTMPIVRRADGTVVEGSPSFPVPPHPQPQPQPQPQSKPNPQESTPAFFGPGRKLKD
jgi:hypothetical protein